MSFIVKDEDVLDKCNEIWDKIKSNLNIKFHIMLVYDETYIKAKVREFNGVIKANFLGSTVPKENMRYTCISSITMDSVMRMEKKNQLQIDLEECKYRIKKMQMPRFINADLKSESDTELMAKLESASDSE